MSIRPQRVGSEIRKSLSTIISELKDPRIAGMVSVVDVEVSQDLSVAKAYVSVFGSDEDKTSTLAGLNASISFIRARLAKDLKAMRSLPEVRFFLDTSMDYANSIEQALKKVKTEGLQNNEVDV